MILHTTGVEYLGDYQLYLSFNNGEAGVVDLSQRIKSGVFTALCDPALFATAYQHPVAGTVAWQGGLDLAPEYLLELMQQQRQRRAA